MPYLQVDLDAMHKWPMVAAGCGIDEAKVYRGFLKLWEACWRQKSAKVTLLFLECLFEAPGRGERIAQVLTEFEFLEEREAGFIVCGAEKYLRISEAKSAGGKKAVANGNLKRGQKTAKRSRYVPGPPQDILEDLSRTGPALTPNNPITHTPNKETTAPADAAPPRLKLLTARLCDDVQEILRRKYLHQGAKDTDALKRIIATEASDFEIRARFRSGLRVENPKNWLCVRTFAQLGQKWNDLAGYGDPPPKESEPPRPRLEVAHRAEIPQTEEIPF